MDEEQFGGNPEDRRKERKQVVDPNEFHHLKRRVSDHSNRLVQLETSNVQQSRESFNLRNELASIVERNTVEIRGVKKQEYIISWLLLANTLALVFSGLIIALR